MSLTSGKAICIPHTTNKRDIMNVPYTTCGHRLEIVGKHRQILQSAPIQCWNGTTTSNKWRTTTLTTRRVDQSIQKIEG
ncbi:hypothetical protein ScPMuIL_012614 [Solemya velum]